MVTKVELEKLQEERPFDDELVKVIVARYLDTLCDKFDGYYDPYDEYEYDAPFEKIFYEDLILTHGSGDLLFWLSGESSDDDSEELKIVFEPFNILLHEYTREADTVSLEIVTLVPVDCQFAKYLKYRSTQQLEQEQDVDGNFKLKLGFSNPDDKRLEGVYFTWEQGGEDDSSNMLVSFIMPKFPKNMISRKFLEILFDERKKKDEEEGTNG